MFLYRCGNQIKEVLIMGLAASQCRILYLTARQSDVEYDMMAIAEQQQRLTAETTQIALEYARATDDQNIQLRVANAADASGFVYENITYANLRDAGYYLVSSNKDIVYVKGEKTTNEAGEEVMNWEVPTDENGNPISSVYTVKGSGMTDSEGNSYENPDNLDNGDYILVGDKYYRLQDALPYIKNYKLINNKIAEGAIEFAELSAAEAKRYPYYQAIEDMRVTFDTSNDNAAYAKYTSAMQRINAKDKELETELKLLETEQTAITKELESIGSVIKDNVDKSYGIFAKS